MMSLEKGYSEDREESMGGSSHRLSQLTEQGQHSESPYCWRGLLVKTLNAVL